MTIDLIQQKLLTYQCQTLLEQENALKEIAQEIALMALSRAGFFKQAAFQGGTCLRILYGLSRFSEDLDFILNKPNAEFTWKDYIQNMQDEFKAYGFLLTVTDKSKLNKAIKTAFLKADSSGGMLILKDLRSNRPKVQIKLEVDTHPPKDSSFEIKFLDFPLPFSIQTQDLPSLFAGKIHALLCREYIKGRDWYDFIWYISKQTPVNLNFLTQAIQQAGPWQSKHIKITPHWLVNELTKKIKRIDWVEAKQDVIRFIKIHELPSLDVWSQAFFLSRVDKLKTYLHG
jgi:predicted nucleotidyltransferase component of viral defense system